MHKIAVVMFSLACAGHGQRARKTSDEYSRSDRSSEALATLLLAFNSATGFKSSGGRLPGSRPTSVRARPAVLDGQVHPMSRRDFGAMAAAAAALLPEVANAYQEMPKVERIDNKDFLANIAKEKAALKPYLDKITKSETAQEFGEAADELSLYIIGKETFPEGLDPKQVRDVIEGAYGSLPKKAYKCPKTRDNKGICFRPGPPADDARVQAINELRAYSSRKGKGGALNSDGVSAANNYGSF